MAVIVKEMLIQLKIVELNNQVDYPNNIQNNCLMHPTEQQKLAQIRDVVDLLKDQETR